MKGITCDDRAEFDRLNEKLLRRYKKDYPDDTSIVYSRDWIDLAGNLNLKMPNDDDPYQVEDELDEDEKQKVKELRNKDFEDVDPSNISADEVL